MKTCHVKSAVLLMWAVFIGLMSTAYNQSAHKKPFFLSLRYKNPIDLASLPGVSYLQTLSTQAICRCPSQIWFDSEVSTEMIRKICRLDLHFLSFFVFLSADIRVLVECLCLCIRLNKFRREIFRQLILLVFPLWLLT